MKKFVCSVCGYVYEGEAAPAKCPQCGAPASKFVEQKGEMSWAAEHVVGVAKDVPEDIKKDLQANFAGECSEVGMYLAMSRVADREGYPEIAEAWKRYAKAIRKWACTMKRLPMKKQNMPPSLPNCWAKSSPTARKRTWLCV